MLRGMINYIFSAPFQFLHCPVGQGCAPLSTPSPLQYKLSTPGVCVLFFMRKQKNIRHKTRYSNLSDN